MKRFLLRRRLIAALLVTLPGLTTIHAQPTASPEELATTVDDGFTLAVVGDIIIAYPLNQMMSTPGFPEVLELLHGADVVAGNMEGNIIDGRTFRGSRPGGFRAEPEAAEWLKEMGVDIVARPNNHANDFGIEGLMETSVHLDRAGVQHAGYGETYWAARSARFVSSDRGRVGMVAASDHLPQAAPMSGEWPGTGGLSPLRVTRNFMVPEAHWDAIGTMRDLFPNGTSHFARGANTDEHIQFVGQNFRKAAPGIEKPYYSFSINPTDMRDIMTAVEEGKMISDLITVAFHAHHFHDASGGYRGEGLEEGEHLDTNPSIADYLPVFSKAAIDHGADVVQGTGVHALRGIEIYKGRPIYYGLAEFIRQMDVTGLAGRGAPGKSEGPPGFEEIPVKYESIIAINEFRNGQLYEARLHPIELRYDEQKLARRGIPVIAQPEVAQRILRRLQELSEPLGTRIEIEGNIGVIRP
ncbi:CapA family protein [Pseudohongiella sp. SYSU M77423]|uniref:CapA family protein n=1 Tax=Pseudohongiella sp. SYSU M77423 TaxID=3042312 RepID=UPI0024805391|nr:CapA family protein [Pseudohongiella sp. SYSU M77423]MDH7943420.1 CapA family protein [Pseudohongiella sp. SYSU M77423]